MNIIKTFSDKMRLQSSLMRRLIPGIAFSLVPIWLLICQQGLSQIPEKALILLLPQFSRITPDMRVSTDNDIESKEYSVKDRPELGQYYDTLSVSAKGSYATLLFVNPRGLSIKAVPHNGRTTYRFPCSTELNKNGEAFIDWEDGESRACERGIRAMSGKNGTKMSGDKVLSKMASSIAQNNDDRRYYCSALPNAGGHGGGITMGETSIVKSCSQAMEQCKGNDSGGEINCSLQTMGEWAVNDPKLMVSNTCGRRRFSQIINGSDSQVLALLERLKKGSQFDNCFLDVYHPDEIIISPESSQRTSVRTTGLGGNLKIEILAGNAMLRSIAHPNGLIAKEGQIAVFDRQGTIRPSTEGNPGKPPIIFPPVPRPPIPRNPG
jgi:hypothetical protein